METTRDIKLIESTTGKETMVRIPFDSLGIELYKIAGERFNLNSEHIILEPEIVELDVDDEHLNKIPWENTPISKEIPILFERLLFDVTTVYVKKS